MPVKLGCHLLTFKEVSWKDKATETGWTSAHIWIDKGYWYSYNVIVPDNGNRNGQRFSIDSDQS
jgi:hypothetical protein